MEIESTAAQDKSGGIDEGITLAEIADTMQGYEEYREKADLAWRVHDGDGLSPGMKIYLATHGMPQESINLTRPIVNAVHGNAMQFQTDIMATADDDQGKEVSEAINQKTHEVWRMTKANDAFSEATTDQLVSGWGWVDARPTRGYDDTGYDYAISYLPWEEMKADMFGLRSGRESMRWWARDKRVMVNVAKQLFPNHHDLIERTPSLDGSGWRNTHDETSEVFGHRTTMSTRKIPIREVYERVYEKTKLFYGQDGSVSEYDPARISQPGFVAEKPIPKIRKSWFIGMVKIYYADYAFKECPFIDMVGYINQETKVPQGLVADMISPQYAYNKAHNEILHILESYRVIEKEGALAGNPSRAKVMREAGRRDSHFKIKEGQSVKEAISVEREWMELDRLNGLKDRSEHEMHAASGAYQSFTGKEDQQMSGKAIATMAELGATNMMRMLGNGQKAKMLAGEKVLEYIVKKHGDQPFSVDVKPEFGSARQVQVNVIGEDGHITNDLTKTKMHIAIASIKSSPAYRMQSLERIENSLGQMANNPEAQNIYIGLQLANSDFPGAPQALEHWNRITGFGQSDEEKAAAAEQQQKDAEHQKMLETEKVMAEVEKDKAQARKHLADAESTGFANQAQAAQDQLTIQKQQLDMQKSQLELQDKAISLENDRKAALIDQWRQQAESRAA